MTGKAYQELESEKQKIIDAMNLTEEQDRLMEEVLEIEHELTRLETY